MKNYLTLSFDELETPYDGAMQMLQIIRKEVERMRKANELKKRNSKEFKDGSDLAFVDVLVLLDEMEGVGE